VVLFAGLLVGSNAHAVVPVADAGSLVQNTLTAAKSALTAASTKIMEVKTSISAAVDEWVKDTAWVQQAKDMWQTIQDINKARETLTNEITGVLDSVTNIEDSIQDHIASTPGSEIDYNYAKRSPNDLITGAKCANGNNCVISGVGYTGVASGVSSFEMRNKLKVDPDEVGGGLLGGVLGVKTIAQISREAAEENAQDIAVIDAMAHEAFTQATNRIYAIEEMKKSLTPASKGGTGPEDEENSLKYINDMQAKIQSEQAYLINDQNRLAALTILQQSQRDMYEQRKKEIANYIAYDDRSGQILGRAAITLATKGAYEVLDGLYD